MDWVLILNARRWKYNPIEGITKRKKNGSTKPIEYKFGEIQLHTAEAVI